MITIIVKTHVELKVSKEKLKEVNKWLEEKVKERTAELNKVNKKLLELDNAKTQFLQIISHEIRTPLNGILGSLDLIKEEIPSESLELLGMLDRSAARLEDFSIEALDISIFNTHGKKAIRTEKAIISHFISKAINVLERKLKSKEIRISQTINTEYEFINVDTNYFYKCIFNIIDNAIIYSPDKGIVTIEVENRDNYLVVEVKDEGGGFDKEFVINDIKPFESKDHVDKNPGLSLYLSNQIIKAHGGTIENGNNKNKGAFVKIIIPIH